MPKKIKVQASQRRKSLAELRSNFSPKKKKQKAQSFTKEMLSQANPILQKNQRALFTRVEEEIRSQFLQQENQLTSLTKKIIKVLEKNGLWIRIRT